MRDVEFSLQSDDEIVQNLAIRAKEIRTSKNISQVDFSKKAGISYHSYNKFESTGKVSLMGFVTIMRFLGKIKELNKLLVVDDIEQIGLKEYSKMMSTKKRQRVSSKKVSSKGDK